jgi:TatA/E family protein of Tat protein translocase
MAIRRGSVGDAASPEAENLVIFGIFKEDFVIEGLFQPMHLILIFGIALLVFGPKKLPELGKGLGDGIRGFKAAMNPVEEKKDGTEV